jgi:hypothetical protein
MKYIIYTSKIILKKKPSLSLYTVLQFYYYNIFLFIKLKSEYVKGIYYYYYYIKLNARGEERERGEKKKIIYKIIECASTYI